MAVQPSAACGLVSAYTLSDAALSVAGADTLAAQHDISARAAADSVPTLAAIPPAAARAQPAPSSAAKITLSPRMQSAVDDIINYRRAHSRMIYTREFHSLVSESLAGLHTELRRLAAEEPSNALYQQSLQTFEAQSSRFARGITPRNVLAAVHFCAKFYRYNPETKTLEIKDPSDPEQGLVSGRVNGSLSGVGPRLLFMLLVSAKVSKGPDLAGALERSTGGVINAEDASTRGLTPRSATDQFGFGFAEIGLEISDSPLESMLRLIGRWESCRLRPYRCSAGRPTIGWGNTHYPPEFTGHRTRPVSLRDRPINQDTADRLFSLTVENFRDSVLTLLKPGVAAQLNEKQQSALISLAYNIGLNAFAGSSLLERLNSGQFNEAANDFLSWCKVKRRVNNALLDRRSQERALFLGQL